MSKPIYITEELRTQWVHAFEEKLKAAKMVDGKFTFTQDVEWEEDDKAKIIFTPNAYVKMLSLLREFNSEVAWHGIVERRGDAEFVITDILVYPQVVTGVTVNTDQDEYTNWMMSIPTETFNKMHMQGHSHVRMGTTPSDVDLSHQESIIQQLHGDHFYIFMIWNKSLEHNIKVYDFRENTLYEDKDCVVLINDETLDADTFVSDAKGMVRVERPQTSVCAVGNGYTGYGGGDNGYGYGRYSGEYDFSRSRSHASDASLASVGVKALTPVAESASGKKPDKKVDGAANGNGGNGRKNKKDELSNRQKTILDSVMDYDSFAFDRQEQGGHP